MRRSKRSEIYAVAEAAGVSVMTVSRAMRGVDGVSQAKRREILEIARRLNYVPNSNARALSQANADLIGISLPTLFNDVFADVLVGMRGTIRRAGFSTVVETTEYEPEAELRWVERLLSWRPAAIILTGVDHHPDLRGLLRAAKVPTLETWDHAPDPIDICVGMDHYAAGQQIGQYIYDLGYRAPAFVGVSVGRDTRADQRAAGIGQAFSNDLIRIATTHENAFRMGAVGTRDLLGAHRPDVIFYLNDHLAFGGMMAAQELGLNAPKDIGIVGFNALDLNTVLPVPLTTVRTPRRLLGVTGARNLLARLHGIKGERTTVLPVDIVAGGTTRLQDQT